MTKRKISYDGFPTLDLSAPLIGMKVTPGPLCLDALAGHWLSSRSLAPGEPLPSLHLPSRKPAPMADPFADVENPAPRKRRHRKLTFLEWYARTTTGRVFAALHSKGHPVGHLVDAVDAVHLGTLAHRGEEEGPAGQPARIWEELCLVYEQAVARTAGKHERFHNGAIYGAVSAYLRRYEAAQGTDAVPAPDWGQVLTQLPSEGGTYCLVLLVVAPGRILIGHRGWRGDLEVLPGFYCYVGNAFGGGGLRARLAWHLTPTRELRLQKQVDTLRQRCAVAEVWYAAGDPGRACRLARECAFAAALRGMPEATTPSNRHLGATDCRCAGHVVRFPSMPSFEAFRGLMRNGPAPCHVDRLLVQAGE